jgi:sugar lactone lactonase YvrE
MTMAAAPLLALTIACGAVGADTEDVRLVGNRAAAVGTPWRATLVVRPVPRAAPRVVATTGRSPVVVRVRRAGVGRYALRASFPRPGRWRIEARVGASRRAVGTVVVAAGRVRLASVLGIALHVDGSVLIADGDGRRVVRAGLGTGRTTTFASRGLVAPTGLAVARDGTVYVADRLARAVVRVRDGAVNRVAEYGEPLHVAVGADGDLFVTGRENTVVRVDLASGSATRYAGTGDAGSSGNGGPALAARLATPHGIALDPAGNVVVAEDASVRRIDRETGVIDSIAGSGTDMRLCRESGPPREICLSAIRVAFEPDGSFYVADPTNARLWRVARGEARAFDLGFPPLDVVVEPAGTVLVADNEGRRVVRFDASTGAVVTVVR